jgi:hypothetical protein
MDNSIPSVVALCLIIPPIFSYYTFYTNGNKKNNNLSKRDGQILCQPWPDTMQRGTAPPLVCTSNVPPPLRGSWGLLRSKNPLDFYFDIRQGKAASSILIIFYTTIAIVLATTAMG